MASQVPQALHLLRACRPSIAQLVGWAPSFAVLGLAGMTAAAACSVVLPRERHVVEPQRAQQAPAGLDGLDRETLIHLAVLCFTHAVVSFSFFVLQAWIPTFLASTGISQLSSIGIFSALPWLVSCQHVCVRSYWGMITPWHGQAQHRLVGRQQATTSHLRLSATALRGQTTAVSCSAAGSLAVC